MDSYFKYHQITPNKPKRGSDLELRVTSRSLALHTKPTVYTNSMGFCVGNLVPAIEHTLTAVFMGMEHSSTLAILMYTQVINPPHNLGNSYTQVIHPLAKINRVTTILCICVGVQVLVSSTMVIYG